VKTEQAIVEGKDYTRTTVLRHGTKITPATIDLLDTYPKIFLLGQRIWFLPLTTMEILFVALASAA
jgi:hypothetical protein